MDELNEPLAGPIHPSAGWTFESLEHADAVFAGERHGVSYGGHGGPTQRSLEAQLAALEEAPAVATVSGMAALLASLLACAGAQRRVVAANDLFGPTTLLLRQLESWQLAVVFVDVRDLDQVRTASVDNSVIVVETISNPRLRVTDIERVAQVAQDVGATLIVDNTLATPFICRPIEHGADLVVESVTKFLSGHSDVIVGCVAGRPALIEAVRSWATLGGVLVDARSAWLAQRGLQTAPLRIERAADTAARVAGWLASDDRISAVHHPGLIDHPDADVSARLLSGRASPMLAFEVDPAVADDFVARLRHIRLASSFGSSTTTIAHPPTMTHRNLHPAERTVMGLHRGFFRLSVGLEPFELVIDDLARALAIR